MQSPPCIPLPNTAVRSKVSVEESGSRESSDEGNFDVDEPWNEEFITCAQLSKYETSVCFFLVAKS